ncbi:hypothetical protein N7523_008203 [Penicillium sp. IBT 18751x]|nr:hypothetical protein N7523_008203 [Penicillium sp. IBT 18751x]
MLKCLYLVDEFLNHSQATECVLYATTKDPCPNSQSDSITTAIWIVFDNAAQSPLLSVIV